MPANYRSRTALGFQPEPFYLALDKARNEAGHSWVNVSRETGVGLDVFRRLRGPRRPDQPGGATPRLDQYFSMAAYIRAHTSDIGPEDDAITYSLIGAVGALYGLTTDDNDTTTGEEPAA